MPKGRKVTFYSPAFTKPGQEAVSASITIQIGNGDVEGIMQVVAEKGGIWNEQRTVFIPYPCAFVEIEDVKPKDDFSDLL
ncbi:MAG TPA: hypothetical protein V6D19_15345 [Stenomitos sp.]